MFILNAHKLHALNNISIFDIPQVEGFFNVGNMPVVRFK